MAAFTAHFRGRGRAGAPAPSARAELPLEERLPAPWSKGRKEGLEADLERALADPRWPAPLDIINGPLMAGMDEVGRLFNDNQLIVAEVLQSAEVMKAAVSLPGAAHGEGRRAPARGKILLATVKGDVHDIGKNLVDIILSNNGFEVVNLGIKVPSERLIAGGARAPARPDRPLRPAGQERPADGGRRRTTSRRRGSTSPLLVGGAALTRRFTAPADRAGLRRLCTYAKDAMHGLTWSSGSRPGGAPGARTRGRRG